MARKRYNAENPKPASKHTHTKAVRMIARRTKKHTFKCCIPSTVVKTIEVEYEDGTKQLVNPDIKPNGNGSNVGPASSAYTDIRDARKKYLREQYRTRTRSKTPWYMLTSGKCWNFETQQESVDSDACYTRKLSEQGYFHNKTLIPKFTREQYVLDSVKHIASKWDSMHPEPQEYINGTKNAFYDQEHSQWIEERGKLWDTTLIRLRDKYTKNWRAELRNKLVAMGARWNGVKIAA